jgi:integrase
MAAEQETVRPNRMRKRERKFGSKGAKFTIEEIFELDSEDVSYYVTERDGFAVRVLPSGVKTFYFKFTYRGKKDQVKIGTFVKAKDPKKVYRPDQVTLDEARKRHKSLLGLYDAGLDPKARPELAQPESEAASTQKKSYLTMTLHELADDYIEFMSDPDNRAKKTHDENKRTINTYILKYFDDHKIVNLVDVTREHAIALIRQVAKNVKKNGEKTSGQARAVLKVARAMFYYQLENEKVEFRNPFGDLEKHKKIAPLMKIKKQGRALYDDEIVQFWNTLNSSDGPGSASAARALMLTLVTAQRPGEVTGMHRDEITGDWWQIPAARIKTRSERHCDHMVYLTPLAKRIIGDFEGFIFPSPSPGCDGKPISEKALTRLVNEGRATKDQVVTRPKWLGLQKKWTPNDLRKTARTKLTGLRCPKDIGEAILNHMKEEVHGTYDLHEYDEEKKEWLTAWSERLESLLNVENTATVRLTDDSYDVKELETLVAQMSLTEVGRRLGITDNAVRKRCRKHGIPLKPQGHWLKGRARGW